MVSPDACDVRGERTGGVHRLFPPAIWTLPRRRSVNDRSTLSLAAERGMSRVRDLLAQRHSAEPRSRRPAFVPHRTGANSLAVGRLGAADNVAIHVGGPLDGIVTITATDSFRVVVEATWGGTCHRDRISLTRPGEREALLLADFWANQLVDGHEPTRDLLRHPRWGWT